MPDTMLRPAKSCGHHICKHVTIHNKFTGSAKEVYFALGDMDRKPPKLPGIKVVNNGLLFITGRLRKRSEIK